MQTQLNAECIVSICSGVSVRRQKHYSGSAFLVIGKLPDVGGSSPPTGVLAGLTINPMMHTKAFGI